MITIKRQFNGFEIRLGDGKKGEYSAHSVEEMITSIHHYFAIDSNVHNPFSSAQENPGCPLCRAILSEHEDRRTHANA